MQSITSYDSPAQRRVSLRAAETTPAPPSDFVPESQPHWGETPLSGRLSISHN